MVDTCGSYDAGDMENRALGGTESSVVQLAEALARRGHDVTCVTPGARRITRAGVAWAPLDDGGPADCDILVSVQRPELLQFVRKARRRVLWMVWAPRNLNVPKYFVPMLRHRPQVICASRFQSDGFPFWLPRTGRPSVVPLGLPEAVRGGESLGATPRPTAIFASNPVRGLRWLVELWADKVLPAVAGAELHIFGVRDRSYRIGEPWQESEHRLGRFLPGGLSAAARASIRPHAPASRQDLWNAMWHSRVMPYAGHWSEAFCLAVAEAQALGVPAIVKPIAVMPERVRDGVTGFVARDDADFARRLIAVLSDDNLWRSMHEAALRYQRGIGWDEAAARFEEAALAGLSGS